MGNCWTTHDAGVLTCKRYVWGAESAKGQNKGLSVRRLEAGLSQQLAAE